MSKEETHAKVRLFLLEGGVRPSLFLLENWCFFDFGRRVRPRGGPRGQGSHTHKISNTRKITKTTGCEAGKYSSTTAATSESTCQGKFVSFENRGFFYIRRGSEGGPRGQGDGKKTTLTLKGVEKKESHTYQNI